MYNNVIGLIFTSMLLWKWAKSLRSNNLPPEYLRHSKSAVPLVHTRFAHLCISSVPARRPSFRSPLMSVILCQRPSVPHLISCAIPSKRLPTHSWLRRPTLLCLLSIWRLPNLRSRLHSHRFSAAVSQRSTLLSHP